MTKKNVKPKLAKRMQHSLEFKQQALQRAVKDGVVAVARDLGLAASQLYAWRSALQQRGQDAQLHQQTQSELSRLKRELARVEEENAFLKKAAAYFAKQPK